MDRATGEHEVSEVDSQRRFVRRFVPVRDSRSRELTEVFGLITSLPAEGDGDRHSRYLLFSRISSAGTEAAAQYFTSPSHLRELAERLRTWPERFQVLIRTTTNWTVALSFSYETHRVIQ